MKASIAGTSSIQQRFCWFGSEIFTSKGGAKWEELETNEPLWIGMQKYWRYDSRLLSYGR